VAGCYCGTVLHVIDGDAGPSQAGRHHARLERDHETDQPFLPPSHHHTISYTMAAPESMTTRDISGTFVLVRLSHLHERRPIP
jgi:hypothetical protein